MATSFATYASQFLNRQNIGLSTSQTSAQPMFYSFTTDGGGSHGGQDTDLDDLNDPHLRSSHDARQETRGLQEEDDDPYLRLDEDESARTIHDNRAFHPQSVPLIASSHRSESPESQRGWLAHLASPVRRPRSPSPSPSTDSGASEPPPDLLVPRARLPPPSNMQPQSLSLTESLLPRDGHIRPLDVFSLPDPRLTPRGRRKYHDSIWTVLWCTGVSICAFFSVLLLFLTHKPPAKQQPLHLPYTTLLHTVPLLTIITFLSALVAYLHIYLLRVFVRPVMIATSFFVPVTLFISAIWAFVGSFMWDGDTEPTWGETVGLRLFALIPLILSIITARRLVHLPETLHVASSTLTLTTHLLVDNPFLLALSPAILLLMLIASIPFLTLIFRLLLVGYVTRPSKDSSFEWHLYTWADWAIVGSVAVWLWSWAVARGILQMTCASVIGLWYFADPDAAQPRRTSTHGINAAILRSTGPSFGTIALSGLLLTMVRLLYLLTYFMRQIPPYIPARAFYVISGVRFGINYLESATTALSKYALVYAGLTGDPFMQSARRARALTSSVEEKIGRYGRRKISSEPPLALLTIAPLTMTLPFALTTYLFVAHTLNAPEQALGAALLAGGVTSLVGLFCVGLVKDTADTLYICYCIDKESGARRREEVFILFEYNQPQRPSAASSQPHRIIPQPPQGLPSQSKPQGQRQQPAPSPLPLHSGETRTPTSATRFAPGSSSIHQMQRPTPLSPSAASIPKSAKPSPSVPPLHSSVREDAEAEDDIDPFQRSYRGGGGSHLSSAMVASQILSEQPAAERMMTSRELNMKSIFLNPDSRDQELSDTESEMEDNESQLLPGSGFL